MIKNNFSDFPFQGKEKIFDLVFQVPEFSQKY
jgi:hypothetical protein